MTSNLVNGYTGIDLLSDSTREDFVDDLIDYAKTKSGNIQPDGGWYQNEVPDGTFTVIRILINREE